VEVTVQDRGAVVGLHPDALDFELGQPVEGLRDPRFDRLAGDRRLHGDLVGHRTHAGLAADGFSDAVPLLGGVHGTGQRHPGVRHVGLHGAGGRPVPLQDRRDRFCDVSVIAQVPRRPGAGVTSMSSATERTPQTRMAALRASVLDSCVLT
jgi:hypothetical protein